MSIWMNLQSMQACIINEPILTLQCKGNSQTKIKGRNANNEPIEKLGI
jgi:hypothetical protein